MTFAGVNSSKLSSFLEGLPRVEKVFILELNEEGIRIDLVYMKSSYFQSLNPKINRIYKNIFIAWRFCLNRANKKKLKSFGGLD